MQARLFAEGTVPEYATVDWYATRDRARHAEEPPHIARMRTAVTFIQRIIDSHPDDLTIVDLGAGDGGMLAMLAHNGIDNIAWGYDLQSSNIDGAHERGVTVCLNDVLADAIDWGDIAIATEMLEHLVDPHTFVATIGQHSRFLIASSPAFETVESHYPFHLWAFDMDGYRTMISDAGWTVDDHRIVDQFQVIAAHR